MMWYPVDTLQTMDQNKSEIIELSPLAAFGFTDAQTKLYAFGGVTSLTGDRRHKIVETALSI